MTPRPLAPAGGYDFHPLPGDLGKVLISTGASTWGGLDRRPGVPAGGSTGSMRPPEA
jgi:hypothetical protein